MGYALASTPCNQDGGKVCDGTGMCVECVDAVQCAAQEVCASNLCVPGECVDGTQNGNETDVDCGGGVCVPCANGLDCDVDEDCVSSFCDGGRCKPCANNFDCPTDDYCNQQGVCLPLRQVGDACFLDEECASDHCPPQDGLCCDTACDLTCESCQASKTGGEDGTCELIADGEDPDNECSAQPPLSCEANGTGCSGTSNDCHLYAQGFTCQDAGCSGGQETTAGTCDGNGICEGGTTADCFPYVCNTTSCFTTCSNPSHCAANHDCVGGDCLLIDGQACGGNNQCASNHCKDGVCCDTGCNTKCFSCLASSTGGQDGVCAAVTNGTDPDDECPGSSNCPC